MQTIVDVEVSFQGVWGNNDSDPSPYNPLNKLVSVGYKTTTNKEGYLIFNHNEATYNQTKDNFKILQDILNESELVIGHNLKFDMSWLLESGFKYTGRYFDTMIFEYVKLMGLKSSLKLKDILKAYSLDDKLDILDEYCGKQGLNVNQVPLKELITYGIQDVNSTYQLYIKQKEQLKNDPLIKSMIPPIKLMNDFLMVLIDVERNGVAIDIDALDIVEDEFKIKHKLLEDKLNDILQRVMGHTPINLNSPEHMSQVIYSRKVKDKNTWAALFNLGKDKYTKSYRIDEFKKIIREETLPIFKTEAKQCSVCNGKGYLQLLCKDGTPRKNMNICHTCERTGIIYTNLSQIGGFNIFPITSENAATGGFSTSKTILEELIFKGVTNEAREFIELYIEYNAISTYLSSFVEGIRKNVEDNNILHTTFNQCVTSTGRLSSTRPNLQNQPRESTFPIRKVFISRFKDGRLLNADYAQLEFRVAAFLAQDANAMADIANKVDVHTQTMNALKAGGENINRQDSKKYTFRPLFGGTSGTKAQLHYFEYFFKRYNGIFNWHNKLCDEAIKTKCIKSPSSRVYSFPFVEAKRNGSVTFATQIKNYEVQGFATGDILPCTMILMHKLMIKHKVKSKLVLTVHDSIVVDMHPEEYGIMLQIFKDAFAATKKDILDRFGVDFNVPLEFDLDIGVNLLNKEKIKL